MDWLILGLFIFLFVLVMAVGYRKSKDEYTKEKPRTFVNLEKGNDLWED